MANIVLVAHANGIKVKPPRNMFGLIGLCHTMLSKALVRISCFHAAISVIESLIGYRNFLLHRYFRKQDIIANYI